MIIFKLNLRFKMILNVKMDMDSIIKLINVLNVRIVKFVHFNHLIKYVNNAISNNIYKLVNNI